MGTHTHRFMSLSSLVILAGVLIVGCQMLGDNQDSLTGPNGNAMELMSYAQNSGSAEFEVDGVQYQLNLSMSQWPSFPFGEPFYLEINQQMGVGLELGVNQVPVMLSEVTYTFENLPSGISLEAQLTAGDEALTFEPDDDGLVTITLTADQLSMAFGSTSLSVWLTFVGGENGDDVTDITLSLSMTLAEGISTDLTGFFTEMTISIGVEYPEPLSTPVPLSEHDTCETLEGWYTDKSVTCDDTSDSQKVSREKLAAGWQNTKLLADASEWYLVEIVNNSGSGVYCDLWFIDNGNGRWHQSKPNIFIPDSYTLLQSQGDHKLALVCPK